MAAADPLPFFHLEAKDPGHRARCAPPATPPPFRATTLVLKQIDPGRLGELGQAALPLFSSFWQEWERTRGAVAEEVEGELQALLGEPGWEVRAPTSADRRFSGDGYLPRGRYYSACHSSDGSDGGTMVRELTAYHDPLSTGIVDIHDVQDEMGPAAGGPDGPDQPSVYLIAVPGFLRDAHPWLLPFDGGHDTAQVVLQAAVTEESFHRLIDLRIPAVAQWFTRNLTRLRWLSDDGEETPAFPLKPPLTRFVDLLPSLLAQKLGGGGAASAIAGLWLRCLGADGLVFPSARSDASVVTRRGRVERFHGWNVVDFRDAPPVRSIGCDGTSEWVRHVAREVNQPPNALYSGVTIATGRRWGREGSWSVQGLQRCNSASRALRSAQSLYRWAADGDLSPAVEAALARGLAGSGSAESLGRRSAAFVRALLGDSDLRRQFVAEFAGLAQEDRAHLDLGAAFGRVDRRLAPSGPAER